MSRPNLPIPRELRDQIYGYLLDSAYTRVKRPEDGLDGYNDYYTVQAYKFETAILAVNREIHDEAEGYLYKNNVFIVASLAWPGFATGEFGGMLWVPIVNAKHVSKMKHHTMRLHFTPSQDIRNPTLSYGAGDKIPLETFLLLENDLRAFCNTLRYHVGFLSGFTIAIADDGPDGPVIDGIGGIVPNLRKVVKPASMKIQLRDNPYRTTDAGFQRRLMDMLGKVSCASMRVSVTGNLRVEDPDYVNNLKGMMGPVLLSRDAAMWANFEILRDAKYLADEIASLGELQRAASLYTSVLIQIHEIYTYHETPNAPVLVTWQPIEALRLDLICTVGFLKIRLRDLSDLAALMEHLIAVTTGQWVSTSLHAPSSKDAQACLSHMLILCGLFLLDANNTRHGRLASVGEIIASFSAAEQTPHVLHDLAILKNASDPKKPAYKHLLLTECSVYKLPLPRLTFHQTPLVPKKPDHIVGRQNLNALHTLDISAKQEINRTQWMYGQSLTKWE